MRGSREDCPPFLGLVWRKLCLFMRIVWVILDIAFFQFHPFMRQNRVSAIWSLANEYFLPGSSHWLGARSSGSQEEWGLLSGQSWPSWTPSEPSPRCRPLENNMVSILWRYNVIMPWLMIVKNIIFHFLSLKVLNHRQLLRNVFGTYPQVEPLLTIQIKVGLHQRIPQIQEIISMADSKVGDS